jgi:hypothetical protein
MTRKDFYIGLAIIIDVLVILTFSLTSYDNFMDYLRIKSVVAFVFWIATIYLIWIVGSAYVMAIVKVAKKKD